MDKNIDKIFDTCRNWDELLNLVSQLINENKKLQEEKQCLVNELINLKLQKKQSDNRRKVAYATLISESR